VAVFLYCWRCRAEVAMLDDGEWASVAPRYDDVGRQPVALRRQLLEAAHAAACERYRAITGVETTMNALWHHRRSLFGPPCSSCQKPLRTPRAKHCAECGADRHRG
jgi:hypothetical protein